VPPRKLKKLSDITADLLWSDSTKPPRTSGSGPGGASSPEPPLKPPKPPAPQPKVAGPPAGPASWTAEERQVLGIQVLARELKRRYGIALTDVHKQPNVGADAVDQHGRYYELKVHVGERPDSESLQPSEFRRATDEEDRFILAVVSGLEEGFKPEIRLIADPLHRLRWEPNVDIVVSGISEASWTPEEPASKEAPGPEPKRV
jgi:hypothetical protein